MVNACKRYLLERAEEWGLPGNARWECLVYNNYHPHITNIVLMWFCGGEAYPRVVTKLFRSPSIPEREFHNLVQVSGLGLKSIPKPLHFGEHKAFWAVWIQGLPGYQLRPTAASAPSSLSPIVERLTRFHEAVRQKPKEGGKERHERQISNPLRLVADFDNSRVVRQGCDAIAAAATPAWLNDIPIVPQHGDLYFGNLLAHAGEYYFLDWESYGIVDLPTYDLVTLLLSLLNETGDAPSRWEPSLRARIPGLVQAYARRIGISRADLGWLLPLAMVNWFALQYQDGREDFSKRMYRLIDEYFRNSEEWMKVFLQA